LIASAAAAPQQGIEAITNSFAYKLLRDFSLPLLAIIWAVYSYIMQNRRKLSIRQVGDQYSDKIGSLGDVMCSYSVEVAITNDSPHATVVIAYYSIELPWNEPNLEPIFDPRDSGDAEEFYRFESEPGIRMTLDRERVLNHQRYQHGKLAPGEALRGYFLARGVNPVPDDLKTPKGDRCGRWVDAKFVVQDTTGKEYRAPIHLHY
jgi:hypothetical protein